MKLWPEDLRCVCVCPRVLTEQLGGSLCPEGPHPQPPLSGESLQPRAGRTLPTQAASLPSLPLPLQPFKERELGTSSRGLCPLCVDAAALKALSPPQCREEGDHKARGRFCQK